MFARSAPQALQLLRWASPAATQQLSQPFSQLYSSVSQRPGGNVPAGHLSSDLRDVACNIGLGRRRDLTLRQDLCLWKDGAKQSLSDVLKGRKVIVVGFPGGPICTEKHLPGYVQMADVMASKGVDKVLAVTVDEPGAVKELSEKSNLKCTKMELLADRNGSFMRLLGLELAPPESKGAGPKCQRFAAIVEDGILIKVCIEQTPKDLVVSDASSMLKLWESVYIH